MPLFLKPAVLKRKLQGQAVTLTSDVAATLEAYDFILYSFFINILGENFFPFIKHPGHDSWVFWIFASGALARPIGSLLFGYYGDRFGRVGSIYYSIQTAGILSLIMTLLPTYNTIGMVAPVLFCLARFAQGISFGGNMAGLLTYMSEISTPKHRAFWVSSIVFSAARGIVLVFTVNALLLLLLSKSALYQWGWRLAFLFGGVAVLLALYFHANGSETPHHTNLTKRNKIAINPLRDLFKHHKLSLLHGVCLIMLFAILVVIMVFYIPTYFAYYGFSHNQAIKFNIMLMVVFSSLVPVFGHLADKHNACTILRYAALIMLFAAYLIFSLLSASNNNILVGLGIVCMAAVSAAILATSPLLLVSIFPTKVRYSGVGLVYNSSLALCSVVIPLIISAIDEHLKSLRITVTIFVSLGALITYIASLSLRVKHNFLYSFDVHVRNKQARPCSIGKD